MQEFRTVIKAPSPDFTISHNDTLLSIGSCFSENIGEKFSDYKFKININPFGQQYNPFSIANAIHRLLHPVPYKKDDLVQHNELYQSFDHHGSFSRSAAGEALEIINFNLATASEAIKKCTVLFLTFGTSHVFRLKEDNRVVSNCHKLPGTMFSRELLTPEEIIERSEAVFLELWKQNPGVKIILTVSPVRYFAFGHYENSVSKAHLFTAIYALQQKYPQLYYFPAYELVMDDLRDYRFFAEDMLHPNEQATNYVWEALSNTLMDKTTHSLLKDIDEVLLAARHRPRNTGTESHRQFVRKYLEKIKAMEGKHSITMKEEENALSAQISGNL